MPYPHQVLYNLNCTILLPHHSQELAPPLEPENTEKWPPSPSGQGSPVIPVKCLCHIDKATQRKKNQEGLGLLIDLWRTQVVNPPLQNICTFFRI